MLRHLDCCLSHVAGVMSQCSSEEVEHKESQGRRWPWCNRQGTDGATLHTCWQRLQGGDGSRNNPNPSRFRGPGTTFLCWRLPGEQLHGLCKGRRSQLYLHTRSSLWPSGNQEREKCKVCLVSFYFTLKSLIFRQSAACPSFPPRISDTMISFHILHKTRIFRFGCPLCK